jgi:hypothetical protein
MTANIAAAICVTVTALVLIVVGFAVYAEDTFPDCESEPGICIVMP